jgi:phosphate transport system permease protein
VVAEEVDRVKHSQKRLLEEKLIKGLMGLSLLLVAASLGGILVTLLVKGLPSLTLEMITETPSGGFYLGKGGGILNAIVGSLLLAVGATLLALVFSLPVALHLRLFSRRNTVSAFMVRLGLDVLWGVPSIVYGAFGFSIMLALGMRASLLAGVLTLFLLELPILVRSMDEILRTIPDELLQASFAVGATRWETALRVALPQAIPGIVMGVLLAFGRGIGDAASVLFTAGYTDRLPTSLMDPVASLPLAVYFQLSTPFVEVQNRAYAAALILTIIILIISVGSRGLAAWMSRYTIK